VTEETCVRPENGSTSAVCAYLHARVTMCVAHSPLAHLPLNETE
jgi:hypothetical protein